jgi:hypothetical protein
MKTKYPSIFGALAAMMLVLSFVVPANLISPTPVAANPGVCKWDALVTPGYLPLKNDVGGSDPLEMVVGGDSNTVLVVEQYYLPHILPSLPPEGYFNNVLASSTNNGMSFTTTKSTAFADSFFKEFDLIPLSHTTHLVYPNIFLVAIAQDNPNFWAIVTSGWDTVAGVIINRPVEVWVTTNGGTKWTRTNLQATMLAEAEVVRCIDISVDYGGTRDLAVGTTDSAGTGDVYVIKSTGFSGWKKQNFDATPLGDFQAIKFSPTYPSDASLVMVYSQAVDTFYNIALRDIDSNTTNSFAYLPANTKVPISVLTAALPHIANADLNKVSLALPSDFSGQAASLRRAYISFDTWNGGGALAKTSWDGIVRMDDSTIYVLKDTSANNDQSIYSIAYFGTYASGKLLAGERMGYACTATVPTWFTDSPTTCPIPCWYPCLKCPTGAAGDAICASSQTSAGSAIVGWRADGKLAFTVTGPHPAIAQTAVPPADGWYVPYLPVWVAPPFPPIWASGLGSLHYRDESAFSISRNNGETWNQLALIDTTISQFTDIAVTPDCKTIYLASSNRRDVGPAPAFGCYGFDSVWRTSSNPDVVSPYPPMLGVLWERVFTHVTADNCTNEQTNRAILRLVPYCADPTGQIVGWAVYDPTRIYPHGIAAWSPDFGDYWAMISPRDPVQDFAFESSTVMYFLAPLGQVQKMPYTGTAWSTSLPSVDSIVYQAHTIAAFPEGKVLVGAAVEYHALLYAASISLNFNTDSPSFTVLSLAGQTPYRGNVHVAFDPAFNDNNTIYIGDDDAMGGGSVYRNTAAGSNTWSDGDMLAETNGAMGCDLEAVGIYGIAVAFTGTALYAAHNHNDIECGVWRTLDNLKGMPKPGIAWDNLDTFVNGVNCPAGTITNPCFTLEPSSLKLCGCCTLDTDTTLYAIDNKPYSVGTVAATTDPFWVPFIGCSRIGLVWGFTDCMAKRGPALVTEDKTLIGCDPVSGRAQEVNLCWEQLCVARGYDLEVGKDADFTIRIVDFYDEDDCGPFLEPVDLTTPCVYFPAGGADFTFASSIAMFGNLECGHTYYWRVKVRECATGQVIRSPWSEVRSFTVKAGLPVVSPYLGLQLLAPNNGCLGCPVQPVSFSWSPYKETTKYKFVLASDAAMTQVVKEAEVATTAYEYDGKLNYGTNYFWRVMSEEPAPSDWSATFSFQTEAEPVVTTTTEKAAPTPIWVWVVIAIGAILVIVTLVLIFKTRRV